MADTSETDGVENRDHETNISRQASKHTGVSSSVSLASSLSKRVKMDGDDDGAPTSILTSPIHQKGEAYADGEGVDGNRTSVITFDSSAESTPKKTVPKRSSAPSTPQAQGHDLSTVDMKMSWDGSVSGGSAKGETTDGETGYKVAFKARAGMLADPVKIAKEREKEERVRQARERLMEERRKKLAELREQQRIAQENREKQLEMRRRKIEDLRRRDSERRAAVEERRKMKEDIERARRESLLQKSEERVARYEAWKAGGRKGGRGHIFGFGSATPRDICQPFERPRRSSSHSALQRRSPNGSDMDSMRPQRRALSACSAVRRHCCVDYNRIGPHTSASAIVAGFQHQQRLAASSTVPSTPLPRSSMTASMPSPVRMRENKSSRKQRPASVASSMPSFVGGEPAKTPRSKSTERTGRDRSKTRPIRKDEKAIKDKENNSEKAQKSVHKLDKIENEKESEKDGDKEVSDKKDKKTRVSLSFYDRLATPKYSKKDGDPTAKVEQPHKKDPTLIRLSPRKAYSTPNLSGMKKRSSIRDKPSMKEGSSKQHPSTAKDTSQGVTPVSGPTTPIAPASRGISPGRKEKSASSTPRITPPSSSTSTPTHTPSVPRPSSPPVQAPVASDDGAPRIAPAPAQDITAEEYKARLAEKRRQAREKAEKEAEEERRRQEEARLAEEERLRKEEEEQRRLEEEAAEARRLEEERLKKAIEAEEKRKKEEADKMEVEKKAKEEADKKAREEAEKLEKEKQEKARREEEERQARKKKLEMIMKRVKPESQTESTLKIESPKSVSSSPNISQVNSSQNSPDEHDKPVAVAPESPSEEDILPPVGSAVEILSAAMTTSFILDTDEDTSSTSTVMTASFIRSASSNDILDSQEVAEEHDSRLSSSAATTPSRHEDQGLSSESTSETKSKFKSPLLQQLVEKKALDSTSTSGPKFKSPLLQNLLGKTKVGARIGMSSSTGDLSHKEPGNGESSMSSSASLHTSQSSFTKELFNQDRDDEDKDEDTSVHDQTGTLRSFQMSHTSLTNGVSKESAFTKSSTDSSPAEAGGKFAVSNMSDSALGSSIEPHMDREFSAPSMMSQSFLWNGQEDVESQGMEDSSISLHSIAESLTTSGFVFDSVPQSDVTAEDDRHFEDLLDLRDSKTSSIVSGAPILAFGENRRQDATESLS